MYFVYILTTQNNTALYVGVPNDLRRRLEEHKNGALGGFSQKYRVKNWSILKNTLPRWMQSAAKSS